MLLKFLKLTYCLLKKLREFINTKIQQINITYV
jgi:hypothetical protein